MTLPAPPLLVITDRKLARAPLPELAVEIAAAGCRWIMLREKDLNPLQLELLASALQAATRKHNVTLVINGNPDVAQTVGAQGVHLPQGFSLRRARKLLGDKALIGASAHNQTEIDQAVRDGADYVTLSPIFPSNSKPDYGPVLGLERLRDHAASAPIPLIALGGITAENAGLCIAAGARGVAVLGSLMTAEDPGAETRRLLESL